jgi:hypothetical protein
MNLDSLLTLAQAKADAASGSLSKAASALEGLLELNPKDADAREALAEIVGQQGRRDLEVGILAEVLQDFQDRWSTADLLVTALITDDREEEAREVALGFLLANPDCVEALNRCAALGIDTINLSEE